MNMYWVYDLPNWLFGALTIGVFVVVGVGGYFATRKWVQALHHKDGVHNDVVGFYLGSLTVFYGVTLGLLMVGVWTNYSDAGEKVSREAATLSALYHNVGHYPEPFSTELRKGLGIYCRDVIDVEWPQQRKGIIPMGNRLTLRRVEDQMVSFEPVTEGQKILHAEAFRQLNQLREQRRMRLESVNAGLSCALWALVLIGALINITVTWFFQIRSTSIHIYMTALFSTLLGLMIFLLAAMDHPFRGEVSIGPDAFQLVYDQTILVYDQTTQPAK